MRRPYGAVNPLTILTIVAVIGGLYWVIFLPKIIDNLDIKEAVEVSLTNARFSDESIVKTIILRGDQTGNHREEDPESGGFVEQPGLGLTEENITIVRDEAAKTVSVTVRYQRDVRLLPLNKWTQMSFTVEKTGSTAL